MNQKSTTLKTITGKRWVNPYLAKINSLPDILLSSDDNFNLSTAQHSLLSSKLRDYPSIFCELCSGSGGHLIKQAKKSPQALFVGFELRYKRSFRTAEKAKKEGLRNLIVLRCDARTIDKYIPAETLSGVYLNFPDPWDRLRWEKHRLLSREFLLKLYELLKPGGFFSYKTDHRERFKEALGWIESLEGYRLEFKSFDLHADTDFQDNVTTEFEELFRSKKVPVNYLYAVKI
ncbi:MAG: tRNA (guanosine(46)-N7)-methyltransferase TrmB [Candidatus Dadabacteria bacterium]|nr:MAG: tRNA (guanosine(46)-N7)-methyltransferase TrmB [Candidatus Dadabacteria bacterium]